MKEKIIVGVLLMLMMANVCQAGFSSYEVSVRENQSVGVAYVYENENITFSLVAISGFTGYENYLVFSPTSVSSDASIGIYLAWIPHRENLLPRYSFKLVARRISDNTQLGLPLFIYAVIESEPPESLPSENLLALWNELATLENLVRANQENTRAYVENRLVEMQLILENYPTTDDINLLRDGLYYLAQEVNNGSLRDDNLQSQIEDLKSTVGTLQLLFGVIAFFVAICVVYFVARKSILKFKGKKPAASQISAENKAELIKKAFDIGDKSNQASSIKQPPKKEVKNAVRRRTKRKRS